MESLPSLMRCILITEFNKPYSVSEVPVPKIKPYQVLLQIKAAGFCHTDLMALNNEFHSKLPFIGSHEPAGIIVSLGSEVRGFSLGDRVGAINFDSCCGVCPDCMEGKPIFCVEPLMKGLTMDGAWAEYMAADARFLVKLDDRLSFSVAAPLMCAGISIYGGIVRSRVPAGGSIGIIGIGGLGHIGTQLAKAMGYKVVAVDANQKALDLANSFALKPDISVLSSDDIESKITAIQKLTGGVYPGVDATVLATDNPASFKLAADLTRKHGTVVLLGQPENGITMSFQDIIFKDLTLKGSLIGDTDLAERLMLLAVEHNIQVRTKEWRLEQAEDMRQEYLAGDSRGKNVIIL